MSRELLGFLNLDSVSQSIQMINKEGVQTFLMAK